MSAAEKMPRAYSASSLAELWGCSERHIRNMVADGRLRGFRLGGKLLRIPVDAVEVGVTGIEPVTPTMSTSFPARKDWISAVRLASFQARVAMTFTVPRFTEPEGTTCQLDQPCHAAVLLEIANAQPAAERVKR